jgi:hypothetical protein
MVDPLPHSGTNSKSQKVGNSRLKDGGSLKMRGRHLFLEMKVFFESEKLTRKLRFQQKLKHS